MCDKKKKEEDNDEWVTTAGGRKVARSVLEAEERVRGGSGEDIPVQKDVARLAEEVEESHNAMLRGEKPFGVGVVEIIRKVNDMYGSQLAGKAPTSTQWLDAVGVMLCCMSAMDSFIRDRADDALAAKNKIQSMELELTEEQIDALIGRLGALKITGGKGVLN